MYNEDVIITTNLLIKWLIKYVESNDLRGFRMVVKKEPVSEDDCVRSLKGFALFEYEK